MKCIVDAVICTRIMWLSLSCIGICKFGLFTLSTCHYGCLFKKYSNLGGTYEEILS